MQMGNLPSVSVYISSTNLPEIKTASTNNKLPQKLIRAYQNKSPLKYHQNQKYNSFRNYMLSSKNKKGYLKQLKHISHCNMCVFLQYNQGNDYSFSANAATSNYVESLTPATIFR